MIRLSRVDLIGQRGAGQVGITRTQTSPRVGGDKIGLSIHTKAFVHNQRTIPHHALPLATTLRKDYSLQDGEMPSAARERSYTPNVQCKTTF